MIFIPHLIKVSEFVFRSSNKITVVVHLLTSCTDDQSLARRLLQLENIIARDSVLNGSGNVGVPWSATHSDHNLVGCDLTLRIILHHCHDCVLVLEVAQSVDVLDFPAMGALTPIFLSSIPFTHLSLKSTRVTQFTDLT